MTIIRVFAVLMFALGTATGAPAQTYPSKPVRMIVGFSPGSATDVLARMVSQKLTEVWSQQVLVDNRTGAGGTVGTGIVAKAPATGYTLLFHSSAYATNAALYLNLPYDPERLRRDFASRQPAIRCCRGCVGGCENRCRVDSGGQGAARSNQLRFRRTRQRHAPRRREIQAGGGH
jgi:hypothetical protein